MKYSIRVLRNNLALCCLLFSTTSIANAEPTELPLFSIEQLEYQGAFRLPAMDLGESNANWASGAIAYNHRNHSLFFAGHSQHNAIAEFRIPELNKTENIRSLNTATPLQGFVRIFQRIKENPDGQDSITSLYYDHGRLIVHTMKFYDAGASARNTTLVINDASNLAAVENLPFYQMEFSAQATGWLSPIPPEWREKLGVDHLVGNGNGRPINGRLSIGPSAFGVNVRSILHADIRGGAIALTPFQVFPLSNPLVADLRNESLSNNLLTELSRPVYGFIVPGTRTYMVIGSSGGHSSGVGYKLRREDGGQCPGFCARDQLDWVNYYWLWDVQQWLAVLEGRKQPFEVRPYAYGSLKLHHQGIDRFTPITGASFDPRSNSLWITLDRADNQAGRYNNLPIIISYRFKTQ